MDQVDEILDEVRLSTTTSVGRLFEWIVKNPDPNRVATAAMGVLVVSLWLYSSNIMAVLYSTHVLSSKMYRVQARVWLSNRVRK